MIPLVDIHCHLCAGLDDGPGTLDEAIAMCRIAYEEGTRWIAAGAHQSDRYPDVTPERIVQSAGELAEQLRAIELPLSLCPLGEVMLQPDTFELLAAGRLLSVGNRGAYVLVEFPAGIVLDIRDLVEQLRRRRLRPILAHPERHPELLFERGNIERLIRMGCLVQVSASSLTEASGSDQLKALKGWVRRGVVHLIGSDGHSPGRRAPRLAAAYHRIAAWAGAPVADRICSTNGLAVVQGLPLRIAPPQAVRRRWWW